MADITERAFQLWAEKLAAFADDVIARVSAEREKPVEKRALEIVWNAKIDCWRPNLESPDYVQVIAALSQKLNVSIQAMPEYIPDISQEPYIRVCATLNFPRYQKRQQDVVDNILEKIRKA